MDIDYFFYYGKVEQIKEIEANIHMNILQPKRSMFYFRDCGGDISEFENKPLSTITKLLLKYNIVKAIADMNNVVTDGSNNTRDMRVLTSQELVDVTSDGQNVDINILYMPTFDTDKRENIDISLGGL